MNRILLLAVSALLSGTAAFAADPTPILDETAYCRSFHEFGLDRIDPELLKKEGEKVLGKKEFEGLKREVKQRHGHLGIAWDEVAWMDNALVYLDKGLQYGDRSKADSWIGSPPPPADWQKSEFDDGHWLRQRLPLAVGPGYNGLARKASFFRFHFSVPDPAQASDLALSLAYRGGVRVFLNGQEVVRGSLPPGDLGPEAMGAPYALEAYARLNPDGTPQIGTGKRDKDQYLFVGEVEGSFDAAVQDKKENANLRRAPASGSKKYFVLDKNNWERFQAVRDRKLAPLTLSKELLKPGNNVLAVEIRSSRLNPVAAAWSLQAIAATEMWDHCALRSLTLKGSGVPSSLERPAGIQIWAEDMHRRVISAEYGPPGITGTVRLVGALNGVFHAEVVVASDKELSGLKATVTELKSSDGKSVLSASSTGVSYLLPNPLIGFVKMGNLRGGPGFTSEPLIGPVLTALRRHASAALKAPGADSKKLAEDLAFFDHISGSAPQTVSANTCQPIWLTLNVPANAAPGLYKGTLKVEAQGMNPATLPVEAEILGWRVPDPADFQTYVALEQSPYGVAKQYNVPLWSDQHFKLLELSFRNMARVGNDWLFVPVISYTEFGNLTDSPIKWIRKKDGSLTFDYTILDRYLDLAVKHLGKPRVISFVVSIGASGNPAEVQVLDEASGKAERLDLSKNNARAYAQSWKAFALALVAHMHEKNLYDSMAWGFGWDDLEDRNLMPLFAESAPGVLWTAGGHRGKYPLQSVIYDVDLGVTSAMGWKRKDICMYNGRGGGSLLPVEGKSLPFNYRLEPDRVLCAGLNGIARMGADYWGDVFLQGLRSEGFLRPGMAVHHLLWPGPEGAESSVRFEAQIEGLQEAEARIFLEQALDRKLLPGELTKKAADCLFQHNRETLRIQSCEDNQDIVEACVDWQRRSRRLFETAAEAAALGLDVQDVEIAVSVPARGSKTIGVKLRNWASQPRDWKAAADAPWIVLEKSAGTLTGHQSLLVTLNAAALPPEKSAQGTITITEPASGRSFPVRITANVTAVLDFLPPNMETKATCQTFKFVPDRGKIVFNAEAGGSETRETTIMNKSGAEIAWKAAPSEPWIRVEPAAGKIPPQSSLELKLTAAPPDKTSAFHEATVEIAEAAGPARVSIPLAVHVISPYAKPALPQGAEPVVLDGALYTGLCKTFKGTEGPLLMTGAKDISWGDRNTDALWGERIKTRGFKRFVSHAVPYEVVFNIEGKGFKAFTAEPGYPAKWTGGVVGMYGNEAGPETDRLYFEIYVDGKLQAETGALGPKDDFRLLAVTGLENAKELKLVVRPVALPAMPFYAYWFDPKFYR